MRRLTKSDDRKLGGVLGGFAEYMDVDPTAIRLIFIFVAIFTGFFPCLFAYVIAAIIMPNR